MRISSLFRGKAYAFRDVGDPKDNVKFASQVLSKFKPRFKLDQASFLGVFDHFDLFEVINNKKEKFDLKISLSDTEGVLKKEVTALKNSKCLRVPRFIDYGKLKVGEEVTCLLTQVPYGENIRNYGRSVIFEDFEDLINAYSEVFGNSSVKNTYRNVLSEFLDGMDPSKFLPRDIIGAFKDYTDYPLCCEFLQKLKGEIQVYAEGLYKHFNYKCHSSLGIDSLFYGTTGFYFDSLANVCMGHPFIDFVDLMLELGLKRQDDMKFLKMVSDVSNIPFQQEIYDQIYALQLRKKLADLVVSYIKEVYLYGSLRYEKIFFIADIFSHCYDRFRSIDIFEENRDFIMKTICEPIFGVKA
jgi:hypothetical protein